MATKKLENRTQCKFQYNCIKIYTKNLSSVVLLINTDWTEILLEHYFVQKILSSSTGRYNFCHSKHKDYYSKIYPLNMLSINHFLLRNLNHKAWMKTPQHLWNYLSLVIFRLKHEYKCHSVTTNRKFEMSLWQQQQKR